MERDSISYIKVTETRKGYIHPIMLIKYMHLYTPDFVRRVGLSCLGCRRFNEGTQAQAQ